MSTSFRPTVLALSLAAAFPLQALAQADLAGSSTPGTTAPDAQLAVLPPVVITAPTMQTPLVTQFNPRDPQQPLPANDGASLLKTIPGMSVIRKGGTDGDPLFRGMAASRLNILIDGEHILGGCGMRMDPPTAYVFPDTFDKVSLIKGPQSVEHGAGASAGTVLFERKPTYFRQPGAEFKAAVTGASFNRYDTYVDAKAGTPLGYVQVQATEAASGDYEDGDGTQVNSAYRRRSLSASVGWTPDEHTRLELSAIESRAKAAYADRSMDGSKFDRSNVGIKFEKTHMSGLLNAVEAQLYYNYVDHVMDNYTLRTFVPSMMMPNPMSSNPDRETTGGRIAVTLRPDDVHKIVLGVDQQTNIHTLRKSGMGGDLVNSYANQTRVEDARFHNLGLFGEVTHVLSNEQRVVGGLRQDQWEARDRRTTLSSGMMNLGANPTANQTRDKTLHSGFVRYEHDLGEHTQSYVGLGYTERAPDYWELFSKESLSSISAFDRVNPEKTTQIDVGVTHQQGPWDTFASAYVSQVQDYILIQSNVVKGMRSTTVARNVDARTWGGEIGAHYKLTPQWTALGSLAYVNGHNRTDDRALGQIPPLEARLGLNWQRGAWSAGSLLRLVASQHRYAVNEGNIVGQDLGRTGGFGVASLHGGYAWSKAVKLSAGVDNLFDKTYAEAISRGGANVSGYDTTTRINEPGRTWWLKLQVALD